MQQHEIHQFLVRYFDTNDCNILENTDSHLQIQLTVNMDKELMNRPFYWHYLEKTGGTPNPMKLTFITDQNRAKKDINGEVIHFGSPRLHQIFVSTKKLSSFVRMYEEVNSTGGNAALQPWVAINTKISYHCDRKKDTLLSLGLNLINGMIVDKFHEKVTSIALTPKIPDYCFTLSPLISPKSGLLRLEKVITHAIENDDHTWAEEARKRQKEDLDLLDSFYEGIDELPPSYHLEKEAIVDQYEPKVHVNIINGGLFYLKKNQQMQSV